MEHLPKVAIVVLNWNKLAATEECIRSLGTLTYRRFHIYLVDNGSEERGIEAIAAKLPCVSLIKNETNLGYAGGNNAALERAFAEGVDFAWCLNNDCLVQPETLSLLVQTALETPLVGMVSPLLMRAASSAELEVGGVRFDTKGCDLRITMDLKEAAQWQHEQPEHVCLFGTALLISRNLYERIGGFDHNLFAYYEDVDLSIRSAQAGFLNVTNFDCIVYHRGPIRDDGYVAPHVWYYNARNKIILWSKHGGAHARVRVFVWESIRRLGEIVSKDVNTRRPDVINAILAGLWDGLRAAGGPYTRERRMPWPLRAVLMASPSFWLSTVQAIASTRNWLDTKYRARTRPSAS